MRRFLLVLISALFCWQTAFANEIAINIAGYDESNNYDGKPICELQYDITNNSTGTIYFLDVSIDGWDDRGTELDEILVAKFSNGSGWSGRTPIALGASVRFTSGAEFKTKCDYLGRIKVKDIKPEYCNIRMLPEDVDCNDIVKVTSELENVALE